MTYYPVITVLAFVLFCVLLHFYRTLLIRDFRERARLLILRPNGTTEEFWKSIVLFNSYGSFEQQHSKWGLWKYGDFYGTAYLPPISLGDK